MNPLRFIAENFVAERERWFLWAPVALGCGIAAYFALPFEPSLWWLAASPLLALHMLLARHQMVAVLLLALLFLPALGFNAAQLETMLASAPMLDREIGPAPITGRLMLAEAMPDGYRLTLKEPEISHVAPEHGPKTIRIKVQQGLNDLPPAGARLSLFGQVGPLSEPLAPGGYDFRRNGYFNGLGGIGWGRGEIKTIDANPSSSWMDEFNLMFECARRILTQHVMAHLSGDSAAMTAALLNGEQTGIGKDVMQAMRVSGLSHLLSISGVHVSMMGLLIYFPLRALLALFPFVALRFPIKKWAALGAILGTAFYLELVGAQAPTLRSTLTTGIMMFAIITDRRALSMRLLTLTAFAVMLMQPDSILGPSFQMSFAAVLAMIAAFEKPIDHALKQDDGFQLGGWIENLRRHAGAILLTSLVATAATTPFTLYHFQQFSFYGVVANMIAIPLTSFWIMPSILLAYIAAPFGLDGLFIQAAGWGVDLIISVAKLTTGWPFALLHAPAMPFSAFVTIVAGGLWLCLWRRHWRYAGLLPILLGMLYPFYTTVPDVMVNEDGKQWIARLPSGVYAAANLDREKFTITQWQQRLGNADIVDIYEMPVNEALRCDEAGCVYVKDGRKLALPILSAAVPEDCKQADIVIAPFLIKDCAVEIVLSDPDFWHHGAHSLSFVSGEAPHIESVRPRRAMRPWSPGWRAPRAENSDAD